MNAGIPYASAMQMPEGHPPATLTLDGVFIRVAKVHWQGVVGVLQLDESIHKVTYILERPCLFA